jgi:D-glycero-alpha-D-manno-heptose-7-phosphate kinase|tara:strand:+ start:318 stop:1319 length:1002 start_codon:yes stop_codon:yes gene_type:complete
MIISKTPYRISFFGGGTDYPEWFKKNNGEVLSTTINKYLYLTCRYLPPFFDHKYRNVWSIIEKVKTIEELKHTAVKKLFFQMKVKKGLELHYDGDLPAQSGMGSSSSFVVGLTNILHSFKKIQLSKKSLADKSIFFEHDILKEKVGYQDQIAASYGGFNSIKFFKNGKYKVQKFPLKNRIILNLNKNLLLVFSGNERRANDIVGKYINKLYKEKKKEMQVIQKFTYKAKFFLKNEKLDDFGHLIGESWIKKKELSKYITTEKIDLIYNLGIKNGALGGKVLGAGGGGMMLFYVNKEHQEQFKRALKNYLIIPFEFENTGSSIIFNSNKENIYE